MQVVEEAVADRPYDAGMSASDLEQVDIVIDEDGFACLVAPDRYSGFVDEDWTLDQLMAHFVEQMNRRSLFAVYPGPDHADHEISFGGVSSSQSVLREAAGIVEVGPAGLWQTDYTQLTMAAQFADQPPVTNYYSKRLPVPEGTYRVVLRQLADGDRSRFELTVSPAGDDREAAHLSVPWF